MRMVEFSDYASVVSLSGDATDVVVALKKVLRRIALTIPRDGEWERCYRALQEEARQAIGARGGAPASLTADRKPWITPIRETI